MQIIADTHVHIYPRFLSTELFPAIAERMDRLSGGREHVNVLCLAERHDCRWFREMKGAGAALYGGYAVEPLPGDDTAIAVCCDDLPRLYVIAGRQVVTRERLEILALICEADIADGAPARDVVDFVLSRGGMPVVSWAPGKWLFGRRTVVEELLKEEAPGRLLVGDSAIRPQTWREPPLMKVARARGFSVVAGTDPLPLAGEEEYIGTYCSILTGRFDPLEPSTAIRKLLASGPLSVGSAGRRCGSLQAFGRLAKQRLHRQDEKPQTRR